MTPSMTTLTEAFETTVLQWPHTEKRNMMGGLCYMAKGKMFATIRDGLVLTKLSDEERQELEKIHPFKPFQHGKRVLKKWAHMTIIPEELEKVHLYIKKSYETALKLA